MATKQVAPGWYRDPKHPGALHYWDGSKWTGRLAPIPPTAPKGPTVWTIARGVALGLAAVIAALVLLGQCQQAQRESDYARCLASGELCEKP